MINFRLTNNERNGLSADEQELAMARKLELMILPHLRRNMNFFYAGGNLKGKAEAYRTAMDENELQNAMQSKKSIEAVCKPLCDLVSLILKNNGVNAETVCCDTDIFKHTDVMITTKSGKKYIINYLEDMENIQTGMRTPDFASEKYYKRRYEKFKGGLTVDGKSLNGIAFLTEEELDKIDSNLNYKKYNIYMDKVIEQIRTEFSDFRNVQATNEIMEKQDITEDEKKAIRDKYANYSDSEILEQKLDWIFDYFNDRMDINGHADFVMYYSRLLLKRVLSDDEYKKISRYDGFAYNNKIPMNSKIRNVLDLANPDNVKKSRFCMLEVGDKFYVFSTKASQYLKLEKEEVEAMKDYAIFSKSQKPSDLILKLCDKGSGLPLVFHPLGSKIINERAAQINPNLNEEDRLKAVEELAKKIITTDNPITSILIPYDDGTEKYLYINQNDEFAEREGKKETIYHYDEENDSFNKEIRNLDDDEKIL